MQPDARWCLSKSVLVTMDNITDKLRDGNNEVFHSMYHLLTKGGGVTVGSRWPIQMGKREKGQLTGCSPGSEGWYCGEHLSPPNLKQHWRELIHLAGDGGLSLRGGWFPLLRRVESHCWALLTFSTREGSTLRSTESLLGRRLISSQPKTVVST